MKAAMFCSQKQGACPEQERRLPASACNTESCVNKLENGKERHTMNYSAKDYSRLIGMQGFSETLLKNHFTLYQGYVTNTNKLLDALDALGKEGKTATPEFAELKRRLGWEFNGMRLHELYFDNLGGKAPLE